jgi:SAM-dependent methyltransferase
MVAWADRIRPAWDKTQSGAPVFFHRKVWEWIYILEALHGRGLLHEDSRGLGFGVGTDPLAAVFASFGCDLVATDLAAEDSGAGHWSDSGQHAATLGHLNQDGICEESVMERHVAFRPADMRQIPADLDDFDFTWSACAFEHLGSLAAGAAFILNQMECLRPGGVAVHTTEFNVSSNGATLGAGDTVLYRRRDIERLVRTLQQLGHRVEVDFSSGDSPADLHVDAPPWPGPHLKIRLDRFVTTSMALIIEKSAAPASPSWRPTAGWRTRAAGQRLRFSTVPRVRGVASRLRHWRDGGTGHEDPVPSCPC